MKGIHSITRIRPSTVAAPTQQAAALLSGDRQPVDIVNAGLLGNGLHAHSGGTM